MTNHALRRRRSALPALLLATLAAGCAPGYRYTDSPALEFRDFDYGFPVKTALQDPRVAYIDVGTGPQTLVLIHGLAANAGFWRYNIPELAKHYRVIAVDLPGYGRSQKSTSYKYDMEFFAHTIMRLMNELQLEDAVLVGHSMGGQVAMTLALHHPERVPRLVLISPAGIESFDQGEGEWLANVLTIKSIREGSEESIRRNLAGNFYSWDDSWEWMVEERARMARAEEMDLFAQAVLGSVHGMIDQPTTSRLAEVKQPALLIYGRYDGLIPNPYLHPGRTRKVFEHAAAVMPRVQLREVDKAGHMVIIEKAAAVNAAILQYLGSGG